MTRDTKIIATEEIYAFIKSWTEHEGWEYSDFINHLESTGMVEFPLTLSDFDKENNSIRCISEHKEVTIFLYFSHGLDYMSELKIHNENETRRYILNPRAGYSEPFTLL